VVQPLHALSRTEFGEGLRWQQQFDGQLRPTDGELENHKAIDTFFEDPDIPARGVARRQFERERRRVGRSGWVGLHALANAWRVPVEVDVVRNLDNLRENTNGVTGAQALQPVGTGHRIRPAAVFLHRSMRIS
jgi:hypothetical protein